jgi:4'-phosphopantetheinyl transferase
MLGGARGQIRPGAVRPGPHELRLVPLREGADIVELTPSGKEIAGLTSNVLALAGSEVHVWWIDFGRPCHAITSDEIERCARFRNDGDRQRFAARRAGVRRVLGGYAAVDPSELAFDRSCQHCGDPSHGRPRLVGEFDLSFSVASAPGQIVVAVATAAMSVGIDIELMTRFDSAATADVWRAALTVGERADADPDDARGIARLWCRKEAVLKAIGLGIAGRPPDSLDVRAHIVDGWHIADLPPAATWVAAVAASSPICRLVTVLE